MNLLIQEVWVRIRKAWLLWIFRLCSTQMIWIKLLDCLRKITGTKDKQLMPSLQDKQQVVVLLPPVGVIQWLTMKRTKWMVLELLTASNKTNSSMTIHLEDSFSDQIRPILQEVSIRPRALGVKPTTLSLVGHHLEERSDVPRLKEFLERK